MIYGGVFKNSNPFHSSLYIWPVITLKDEEKAVKSEKMFKKIFLLFSFLSFITLFFLSSDYVQSKEKF